MAATGRAITCIFFRDFSRFSEDRPTHTEYGFEAVTLSVCAAEKLKILKFQKFVGLDGDGRTHSRPPYAVGSCSNDQ